MAESTIQRTRSQQADHSSALPPSSRRTLPPLPPSFRTLWEENTAISERSPTENRYSPPMFGLDRDVESPGLDRLPFDGRGLRINTGTDTDTRRGPFDRDQPAHSRPPSHPEAGAGAERRSSRRPGGLPPMSVGRSSSESHARNRPGSSLSLITESDAAHRTRQGRLTIAEINARAGPLVRQNTDDMVARARQTRHTLQTALRRESSPDRNSHTRTRSSSPASIAGEHERDRRSLLRDLWFVDDDDTSVEDMDVEGTTGARASRDAFLDRTRAAAVPLSSILSARETAPLDRGHRGGRQSPNIDPIRSLYDRASALGRSSTAAPFLEGFYDELRSLDAGSTFAPPTQGASSGLRDTLPPTSAATRPLRIPERSHSRMSRLPSGPRPPSQNFSSRPILPPINIGPQAGRRFPWDDLSPDERPTPSPIPPHPVPERYSHRPSEDRSSRVPHPLRDSRSHNNEEGNHAGSASTLDRPTIDTSTLSEGPMRATLERYMGNQTRSRAFAISSGAGVASRPRDEPAPSLPPLPMQSESSSARRPPFLQSVRASSLV